MLTRRSSILAVIGSAVPMVVARAAEFPARPITLIAPVSPGAALDVTSRSLAAASETYLAQPIVVENMPGASATLGPARVAALTNPDGYTLTVIPSTVFRLPFLRKTPFDPTTDFTYIIGVARVAIGLVVKRDAPWATFQDFLAAAKANPGKINYGTGGVGTTSHVVMEAIAKQLGISWTHVPFKEGAAASALLGGFIQAVADPAYWAPLVRSGQLRLLVSFGPNKLASWPTAPTLKESGIDLVGDLPYGIAGPRGMEPAIVRRLHDAFKQGLAARSLVATMAMFEEQPFYLDSSGYRDYAMRQIALEKRLVDELGLSE